MIEFQLDTGSGVATYLQLVQQVHQALQLGLLEPGDQLPTASRSSPNRDQPKHGAQGLPGPRARGPSTAPTRPGDFLVGTLPRTDPATQARFLASMTRWLRSARAAGLGPDDIEAIYRTAWRNCFAEGVA